MITVKGSLNFLFQRDDGKNSEILKKDAVISRIAFLALASIIIEDAAAASCWTF